MSTRYNNLIWKKMTAFVTLMTMIQLNTAPILEPKIINDVYDNTHYAANIELNRIRNNVVFSRFDNDTKAIWLEDIGSIQKKIKEVSIITDWIVPVTVTAVVGGLVYSVYHFRGR